MLVSVEKIIAIVFCDTKDLLFIDYKDKSVTIMRKYHTGLQKQLKDTFIGLLFTFVGLCGYESINNLAYSLALVPFDFYLFANKKKTRSEEI